MNIESKINGQKTEELTKVTAVEGTPFTLVKYEDRFFIGFGHWRVSESFKSEKEALAWISTDNWDLLLQVIYAVATEVQNVPEPEKVVQDAKKPE